MCSSFQSSKLATFHSPELEKNVIDLLYIIWTSLFEQSQAIKAKSGLIWLKVLSSARPAADKPYFAAFSVAMELRASIWGRLILRMSSKRCSGSKNMSRQVLSRQDRATPCTRQ